MSLIPLSHTVVLLHCYTFFAAIFSFFILKESFTIREGILSLLGFLGVYILVDPNLNSFSFGHILAMCAAVSAGLGVVIVRKLRASNPPLVIYLFFCFVGAAVCFPNFLIDFKTPNGYQLFALISAGILLLLAQILMNQGFKFCKANEGSVILTSRVVFVIIMGYLIFGEKLTLNFWIGSILILGSGIALSFQNKKLKQVY